MVSLDEFEAAFREHFPLVYRFIARRVGSAIAEDLAAETFATGYRRRATFDPRRASLRLLLGIREPGAQPLARLIRRLR